MERFVRATRASVDAYLCLGDTVNYGPWNDECLEMIQGLPGIMVLEGNHERLFLNPDTVQGEILLVQKFFDRSYKFFSRRDLINALPTEVDLGKFGCTHTIGGSYVYADSDIVVDRNYVLGHTHHQFRIERSGFELVNPGSVGQNRRYIDAVDYAVLDTESQYIDLYSEVYDFDLFRSELICRGYPQECVDYYSNKPRRP